MGIRSRQGRERRKAVLWRLQKGRCYWCEKPMKHWNEVNPENKPKIKRFPRNMATIDHLRDRFHPLRQEAPKNQEQRLVLACWQCNFERGRAEQAAQPIEVLHERAGRHASNGASCDA